VELPLYIWFIVDGDYNLDAFSWHKFQSTFLFLALSITISDWSSVLYDIREYQIYTFLFHKWTLIFLNFLYFLISTVNFIFCYWTADLGEYSNSPVYLIGLFFQICMSMLVTFLMLHAGLKLYGRIQGAAGKMGEGNSTSNSGSQRDSHSHNNNNNSQSHAAMSAAALPPVPSPSAIPGGGSAQKTTTMMASNNPLLSQVRNINDSNENELEEEEETTSTIEEIDPESGPSTRTGSFSLVVPSSTSISHSHSPTTVLQPATGIPGADKLQILVPQPIQIASTPSGGGGTTQTNSGLTHSTQPNSSNNSQLATQRISNSLTMSHSSQNSNNNEFRNALINLNIVMAMCTFCILLQVKEKLVLCHSLYYQSSDISDNNRLVDESFFGSCFLVAE
jgi:hypothetical protein